MQYIQTYSCPIGKLLMASDGAGLLGLWFFGQKYFACGLQKEYKKQNLDIFKQTKRWLDIYFSFGIPDFTPALCFTGTAFQRLCWQQLLLIPYGKTTTYSQIAKAVAAKMGKKNICPQAAGQAIGHNKISIIVPCHRVISKSGLLTGYAAGLEKKAFLLSIESRKTNKKHPPL